MLLVSIGYLEVRDIYTQTNVWLKFMINKKVFLSTRMINYSIVIFIRNARLQLLGDERIWDHPRTGLQEVPSGERIGERMAP